MKWKAKAADTEKGHERFRKNRPSIAASLTLSGAVAGNEA
jgi:hypothetical protein